MNAGRELDALVAEKVMGWESAHMDAPVPVNIASAERWRSPDGKYHYLQSSWRNQFFELPAYSTDIAAAWLVVERLREMGLRVKLMNYRVSSSWDVEVDNGNWESGEAAPHAICLAALKAAGVDV